MKTRHMARIVGHLWNKKVILVLQVYDTKDGPCDSYGLPEWCGGYWRDARIQDLTTLEIAE